MIRVSVTDKCLLVIKGLEVLLNNCEDIKMTTCYCNGEETLKGLSSSQPDILFLEINLSDYNGIKLCKILYKKYPKLHIIALTNFSKTNFVRSMIKSGAKGYLLKTVNKEELVLAINNVFNGKQYLQKSIQKQLLNETIGISTRKMFIPKLTRREDQVLNLIAEEHTSNEIAEKLFVSVKTIESHRKHLIEKLNVRNTAGLMRIAMEKGLIS
jgi:DNA-binding NarL/FixJ family response regulator